MVRFVVFSSILLSLSNHICNTSALAPNSWQKRIDRALLDIDGARTSQARFRLIQRALRDPKFSKDVSRGFKAVQEKGIGKGHPELIDALWPKGTIARGDIEGIQGLIKSLPERLDEIRDDSSSIPSLVDTIQAQDFGILQRALEDNKKREQCITLAQNVFRRYPKNVKTLPSTLLTTVKHPDATIEIRRFNACNMVVCQLDSDDYSLANMGSGLVQISNWILRQSNNIREVTSPFIIQNSTMFMWINDESSIVEVGDAGSAGGLDDDNKLEAVTSTTMYDGDVSVEFRQPCTMALLEFPGICTNGEIERQKISLLQALKTMSVENDTDLVQANKNDDESKDKSAQGQTIASWKIVDDSVQVLQYNSPGTLPWRRRNQIGLVVQAVDTDEDAINGFTDNDQKRDDKRVEGAHHSSKNDESEQP